MTHSRGWTRRLSGTGENALDRGHAPGVSRRWIQAGTVSQMTDPPSPREGSVLIVLYRDRRIITWWGPGPGDSDCLATIDGEIARFASVPEAEQVARERSWPLAEFAEPATLDLNPVVAWLGRRAFAVDPNASLDMWNLADDVAYTLGLTFNHRGTWEDACHDRLTAITVPYLFPGLENRDLHRWTPRELRVLRRVMGSAMHVIRQGLLSAG